MLRRGREVLKFESERMYDVWLIENDWDDGQWQKKRVECIGPPSFDSRNFESMITDAELEITPWHRKRKTGPYRRHGTHPVRYVREEALQLVLQIHFKFQRHKYLVLRRWSENAAAKGNNNKKTGKVHAVEESTFEI